MAIYFFTPTPTLPSRGRVGVKKENLYVMSFFRFIHPAMAREYWFKRNEYFEKIFSDFQAHYSIILFIHFTEISTIHLCGGQSL